MSGKPPRISFRTPSEDELRSLFSESIRFSLASVRFATWVGSGTQFESDALDSLVHHAERIVDLLESPSFKSTGGWGEELFVLLSRMRSFHRVDVPELYAGGDAMRIREAGLIVLIGARRVADAAGLAAQYDAEVYEVFDTSEIARELGAITGEELAAEPPSIGPAAAVVESLTPGARAIAAAYDLQKEGKPVSVRAACLRAKVDRPNLRKNYPEAIEAIEAMSGPDRKLCRGGIDARSGSLDGWDSADFG